LEALRHIIKRIEKPTREEISGNFRQWLKRLQYEGTADDGKHPVCGIAYVPDLSGSRA
jgi:hypothetical protein